MQPNPGPGIRNVELPQRISPLPVRLPLRLLVVIASPDEPASAAANAREERQRLLEALAPLIGDGSLEVEWLESATLQELHRTLRQTEFHILHIIGRGVFDPRSNEPALVLEDQARRARPASAANLGVLLQDYRSVRLAVLAPLQGAVSSGDGPFSDAATTLVRNGLPAVLAIPVDASGGAARQFTAAFYAAVASGQPLSAAMADAERTTAGAGPVLYLGVPDGVIFSGLKHRGRGGATEDKLRLGAQLFGALRGIAGRLPLPAGLDPRLLLGLGGGGAIAGAIAVGTMLLSGGNDGAGGGLVTTPEPATEVVVQPTEIAGQPVERIVFGSLAVTGERRVEQVFTMAPDGSDRQQLTSNVDDSIEPSAGLNCGQVAFVQRTQDAWELYVLDIETGEQKLVPAPEGWKSEPALSPDGQRVVYALHAGGDRGFRLYITNVDGSDARPLTGANFDERDAAWAPDGSSIAFVSDRDHPGENHEIYRIAPDESLGPQRLTNTPLFDGEPAWSPDGSRIVFQSVRDETDPFDFSLWIVDSTSGDAGGATRLTDEPGREYDPAWSPDGSSIAYTYQDGDTFNIYRVDASGGTPVNLTAGGMQDTRPSWCLHTPSAN
jgi:Tol biopolymer transport system component